MKNRTHRKPRSIKDVFLPHAGNGYKPLIFTAGGVLAVALLLIVLEAGYLFDTKIANKDADFLASVLPAVLADMTNQDRTESGAGVLAYDTGLAAAAQLKADDMAEKGYFAHVSPEGREPWYWLDQVAYPYTYAGENLAVNFDDSKDVEDAWMNSPTHHANIVKPQYTHIGIATARGMYQGRETTFVVQFFATPRAGAVLPDGGGVRAETASSSVEGAVLGAAIEPSFLARIAASPNHSITYALAGIAGFLIALLLLAVIIHARIQFIEVIGGGLLLILAAISLLIFNGTLFEAPEVPQGQPAAAIDAA